MSESQLPPTAPLHKVTRPWLWWIIVALVLLNSISLVLLWMHRPCAPPGCGPAGCESDRGPNGSPPMMRDMPPRGPQGMRAFEFIAHEVGMNEQQRRAYEDLRDRHHLAMRPIQDSIHDLRSALFSQLSQSDETLRIQQLNTIAHLTMLQDSLTVQHFRQVRALLTPDQQQRFDSIISEAARMMAQPPPPQGPGGPNGPDREQFRDDRTPRGMNRGPDGEAPPPRRGRPMGPRG